MQENDTRRPSELWKRLSGERRAQAAEAFWRDENALIEQAEVMGAIARRIKFRLKSVQAMPIENKVRHLLAVPAVSEAVIARLLVSYHLAHQRAMMGTFLDAVGIAHEDGLITEDALTSPPADRLKAAAAALRASYPAEDVSLYLSTLHWQDPETWAGLSDLPEVRQQPAAAPPQRA